MPAAVSKSCPIRSIDWWNSSELATEGFMTMPGLTATVSVTRLLPARSPSRPRSYSACWPKSGSDSTSISTSDSVASLVRRGAAARSGGGRGAEYSYEVPAREGWVRPGGGLGAAVRGSATSGLATTDGRWKLATGRAVPVDTPERSIAAQREAADSARLRFHPSRLLRRPVAAVLHSDAGHRQAPGPQPLADSGVVTDDQPAARGHELA